MRRSSANSSGFCSLTSSRTCDMAPLRRVTGRRPGRLPDDDPRGQDCGGWTGRPWGPAADAHQAVTTHRQTILSHGVSQGGRPPAPPMGVYYMVRETAWPRSPEAQPATSAHGVIAHGCLQVCGRCRPVCPHVPVIVQAGLMREGRVPMLEPVTRTSPGVFALSQLRHVPIFPRSAGCAELHATVQDNTTALSPTYSRVFSPTPRLHQCARASFGVDSRHV